MASEKIQREGRRTKRGFLRLALLAALALGGGCRTPIHADRTSVSAVYRELRHSALDGGEYSDATRVVLHRYDWEQTFRSHPAQVLRQLHEKLLADDRTDVLLALVELNYFHADRLRRGTNPAEHLEARDFFLAASVYAYFYVLAAASGAQSNLFGPGPDSVRDFYNRSVAQALTVTNSIIAAVRLEAGVRRSPIGPVEVRLNTNAFPWPLELFPELVMADAYSVKGLSKRNRQAGLGAPLIATARREAQSIVPPRLPITVFLRVEGRLEDWSAGRLQVSLEVYSGHQPGQVEITGQHFPLETDFTAPLAYALNDASLWKLGRRQFFSSREIVNSGIHRIQPYQPGRIPVVFVHGTFSSPVYWAEMWNTLASDPVLSRRCQFWCYIYNSGNPIAYSAANLRDALTDTAKQLDPEERDPALRQTVVIGHSQGGLLAKLSVTSTGDKLWRLVSDQSLDELDISEDFRAQLRRTAFIEPVPSVKRVVFIATPHRGSYLATGLTRRLATRFVSLPRDFLRYASQMTQLSSSKRLRYSQRGGILTSLDGMSPKNPALLALAEIPPAPGVTSHSIIAVSGHRPLAEDRDGLVAYPSAHVDYAASELVLHAAHSCQSEPAAIEEVRRILLEHIRTLDSRSRIADGEGVAGCQFEVPGIWDAGGSNRAEPPEDDTMKSTHITHSR